MLRLLPFVPLALLAQAPRPPSVVSPEVHADRTVTFRLLAPQAKSAAFQADWMPAGQPKAMTRGADGIWSVTVGPLAPTVYVYTFVVDGLTIADPVNPRIKLRSSTSASMVEVAGEQAQPWDPRDVPHGSVDINWVQSKSLGGAPRQVWVYTPPGYAQSGNKRYPVLYLLHGSNDTAGGWVLAGHANFILDNLIAARKATPMIVVMPYGHAVPFGSKPEIQATNTEKYERHLVSEVMPMTESKYRVAAGKKNRAIAGLSMGGGQTLHIGFGHLDLFNAIGAFSSAVPRDFETRFAAALADAKSVNAKLPTLWIGCGREDFLFANNQKFTAMLNGKGIRHTWRETEGPHTFAVWRRYLAEFAPLLFQ